MVTKRKEQERRKRPAVKCSTSFSDDEDEEEQYDGESMKAVSVENPLIQLARVYGEERDARNKSETEFP
jgi:hypothetical protein